LFDFDFETESFELKQQIDTAAVLDQKWHCDQPYLAIANSIGEVLVFHLVEGKLCEVAKTKIGGGGIVLALSLDWDATSTKLVVSDSKGGVSIVNFNLDNFRVVKSWHAHGFEAWTCAFDQWNDNVVYTGK
jgi:diphthine methyl ester acylhydrolase